MSSLLCLWRLLRHHMCLFLHAFGYFAWRRAAPPMSAGGEYHELLIGSRQGLVQANATAFEALRVRGSSRPRLLHLSSRFQHRQPPRETTYESNDWRALTRVSNLCHIHIVSCPTASKHTLQAYRMQHPFHYVLIPFTVISTPFIAPTSTGDLLY